MPSWLSRMFRPPAVRAAEGAWRPGPYMLSNGWLPAGTSWNYFQLGQDVRPYGEASAMVEACISAYAQTTAMCPGDHWRALDNGGRERVTNSGLSRVLRRPNDYQTISDFLMNVTRRLYSRGEAFALALRNDRGEIEQLHWMREGQALVAEDGSVFYSLYGNEVIERRLDLSDPVPARDVLHVRLHTPKHPLKGVSPILATALELAMNGAALGQQIQFYLNQARPSYILETDEKLTKEQIELFRANWQEQTTGANAGKTPILNWGMKAKEVTRSASDGQLADMLKMTDANVALAFRVPLAVLGVGGTTFASTELLMQQWIASGLGFCLNHIEEAFGQLFKLRGWPDEYLELNTAALQRSAHRERIEALARGVISGIFSPDEARASEDLPAVSGGHGAMPRVQQQVVPLSYGTDMKPPDPNRPAPALAPPKPESDSEGDDAQRERQFSQPEIDSAADDLLVYAATLH